MTEDLSFQDYIANSRDVYRARRAELVTRRAQVTAEIDDEIAWFDRELAAINAYEAAKTGRKPAAAAQSAAPRRRGRPGPLQESILRAISESVSGMSRGDLINMFGFKGDRSAEMSISNALVRLVKTGALYRDGGKYHAPAAPLHEAAE